MRYTYLSWATPPYIYICVCGCLTYAAVMQQGAMQTNAIVLYYAFFLRAESFKESATTGLPKKYQRGHAVGRVRTCAG